MPRNPYFYDRLATATGEDCDLLTTRGFQPSELSLDELDEPDEREPLMMDWDAHHARSQRRLLPFAS